MYLSLNIKYLRKSNKLTQSDLADNLSIGRGSISNYEKEVSSPDYDTLIKIADFFGITTDSLLRKDLSMTRNVEKNVKIYDKNTYLKPDLSTDLNGNNEYLLNNIVPNEAESKETSFNEPQVRYKTKELVPNQAPNLFIPVHQQTTYIMNRKESTYEHLRVPSVTEDARTFEVEGYKLAPYLTHGDYLICTYIPQVRTIKSNIIYAIVTVQGIMIAFIDVLQDTLLLRSTNEDLYPIIEIKINEIREIWESKLKITKHIIPANETVQSTVKALQQDYNRIKSQITAIQQKISTKE